MTLQVLHRPPSGSPALVLNADYRPLSYYPLSLWPWQDVIKAVFLERVDVVSTYDQVVRSPSFEMRAAQRRGAEDPMWPRTGPPPSPASTCSCATAFTCQYCRSGDDLTFDHIDPRSQRRPHHLGPTSSPPAPPATFAKGGRTPREAGMVPGIARPAAPPSYELQEHGRRFPPNHLHEELARLPLLGHRTGGMMAGLKARQGRP